MASNKEISGLPPAGMIEQPPPLPLLLFFVAATAVAADKGNLATPVSPTTMAPAVAGWAGMSNPAELVFADLGEKLIVTWQAVVELVQVLLVMLNDAEFVPVIVAVPSATAAPGVKVTVLLMVPLADSVPKSSSVAEAVMGEMLFCTANWALSIPAPQFFRVAQS